MTRVARNFMVMAGMLLVILGFGGCQAFSAKPKQTITRELLGPFSHEKGYTWTFSLPPEFSGWGDSQTEPEYSTLVLYENGKLLGPGHSLHESIRNQGQGRYSHWGGKLYFSTSDNSDPNNNGREYSINITPPAFHVPMRRLVYLFLALALAGGIAGLLLIKTHSHNSLIKKWLYFLTLFNLFLMAIIYANIIPPLTIFGKGFHILIFIVLLIAFSSIFIISHEIKERGCIESGNKLTFNIITIWSLIGVFLLLFEVFFRIFPIYDTLAINPGVKFFWPDYVNYPLNNMGFRDRTFNLMKNSRTYRIMVVGDSYAEGAGCRREETFSRVLEQELNRRLQAAGCPRQVEVYNFSSCGANTMEEVQVVLKEAPVLHPDLIILAYVLNDPEVHPPDLKAFDPPAWVADIHRTFLEKIHSYAYYWFFTKYTLFRGNIPPGGDYNLLIHNPDYHGWKKEVEAVSTLREFTKKNKDDVMAIIFPPFSFEKYPSTYRHVHKQVYDMISENNIDTFDLLRYYEEKNKDMRVFAFSKYDAHPNPLAHKLLGQFLASEIWERESFKRARENCSSP